LQRDLKDDQEGAALVCFQIFSARQTVHRKAQRVGVNHGLDLVKRFENLVITGACMSSKKERVVL